MASRKQKKSALACSLPYDIQLHAHIHTIDTSTAHIHIVKLQTPIHPLRDDVFEHGKNTLLGEDVVFPP